MSTATATAKSTTYTATHEGVTYTRKSKTAPAFAVISTGTDARALTGVWSWCGRHDLAVKAAATASARGEVNVVIVPVA